jgi:hypothetical protein
MDSITQREWSKKSKYYLNDVVLAIVGNKIDLIKDK